MSKINIDMDKVVLMLSEGKTHIEIAKFFKCGTRTIQTRISELNKKDVEIIKENARLAKQKQRFQDLNRIERKAFRDHARQENASVELYKEIISLLKSQVLPASVITRKKTKCSRKKGAIFHITDVHFGELVNIMNNKYDFTVASQRLAFFVQQAKIYLNAQKINNVTVCLTGDLLNSARRLDEMLSQASNRSKALLLSVHILRQLLVDLAQDYNVSVISVTGNESRLNDEPGFGPELTSDNFDYLNHYFLQMLLEKTNIKFFDTTCNEQVIEIVGQNVLAIHGHQVKGGKTTQAIQKIIGKYSLNKIAIDFVVMGHVHACKQSDFFARSASVVGGNAYSDNGLQLYSRASQNLHIFYDNGNRDSIKIDLQNMNDINGYSINKELEVYQCKSVDKLKRANKIHRIIIK